MIYIIVGKSCSGKSLAREHFESKGFVGFEASDYMKRSIEKHDLHMSKQYELFGRDFIAREIYQDIQKGDETSPAVLSGLRTLEGLQYLDSVSRIETIGIRAPDRTRYDRNFLRNRHDANTNFQTFMKKKREKFETYSEMVDLWIENNGDLDSFYKRLDIIINEHGGDIE